VGLMEGGEMLKILDRKYHGTMSRSCNWCFGDCEVFTANNMLIRIYKCKICGMERVRSGL